MPRPNSNRPVYYDEGGTNMSSNDVRTYTDNHNNTYQAGKYDYISSMATPQQVQSVYNKYGIKPTEPYTPRGGDPGTLGSSGGNGGSGGGTKSTSKDTTTESIWEKWLSQLKESQDELLAALKAANEQGQSDLAYQQKLGREQNNRWLMTANRQIGNMYGGENSGAKLYAMSRNQSNWLGRQGDTNRDYLSNLSKLNTDYANNVANAKSNYANQLFNAWNTKYGYDTDLNYKKYLMDHGYLG